MIKLYNYSKLSDTTILPILKQAFKLADLKGKLVVVVTKGYAGGGKFYDCKNLKYKPYFNSERFIKSDAGFVIINPLLRKDIDSMERAEHICETILHEFKHSSDYINGVPFTNTEKYSKRPHEIRARFFSKYEASIEDDLILNLAIEIEKLQKRKK